MLGLYSLSKNHLNTCNKIVQAFWLDFEKLALGGNRTRDFWHHAPALYLTELPMHSNNFIKIILHVAWIHASLSAGATAKPRSDVTSTLAVIKKYKR